MSDFNNLPERVPDEGCQEVTSELITRCTQANEPEAWRDLLDFAQRHTLAILKARGVNPEDAKDLCQQTLRKIIKSLDTLLNPKSFRGWLNQIVRNTLRDQAKAAGFRERFWPSTNDPLNEQLAANLTSEVLAPDLSLERQEGLLFLENQNEVLRHCLEELKMNNPLGFRLVNLHFGELWSFEKISRRVKRSVHQVKELISIAIQELRRLFIQAVGETEFTFIIVQWTEHHL